MTSETIELQAGETLRSYDLKEEILSFLEREAEADLAKAILSFRLLVERGAGVGGHSTQDFYENAKEALLLYADATDRLSCIEKLAGIADAD